MPNFENAPKQPTPNNSEETTLRTREQVERDLRIAEAEFCIYNNGYDSIQAARRAQTKD